jgi:ribosomal protein S17
MIDKRDIRKCVSEIIDTLCNRNGFDDWWYNLDSSTEADIEVELFDIIYKRLKSKLSIYKIEKYDKFFMQRRNRNIYSFHVLDNNCSDIKVGDIIEIDGISGEVEELIWFMKSFGIKGDDVSVLIKDN